MPNVLAIRSDSSTHEAMELDCALAEMYQLVKDGDGAFFQQKGFVDARDYLNQLSRLTVTVVCGWEPVVGEARNHIWRNIRSATLLPQSVRDFLAVM